MNDQQLISRHHDQGQRGLLVGEAVRKVYSRPRLSSYGPVKDVTLGATIVNLDETGGAATRPYRF